eukprot:3885124-Rhodomonas_salina.1
MLASRTFLVSQILATSITVTVTAHSARLVRESSGDLQSRRSEKSPVGSPVELSSELSGLASDPRAMAAAQHVRAAQTIFDPSPVRASSPSVTSPSHVTSSKPPFSAQTYPVTSPPARPFAPSSLFAAPPANVAGGSTANVAGPAANFVDGWANGFSHVDEEPASLVKPSTIREETAAN